MHRSGTSLATGTLSRMGLDLGGAVLPPGPDNPKGYFEHGGINDVHEDFLAAIDSHWSDPRPLDGAVFDSEAATVGRQALRRHVESDLLPRSAWVLKNPRLCRLQPLWRDVFPSSARPHYLLLVRHPLEVAASLAVRNRFPLELSVVLWLRHMLEAEAATRGAVRATLLFDDLAAGPEVALRGIGERWGLGRCFAKEDTATERLFDPHLVHQKEGLARRHAFEAEHPVAGLALQGFGRLASEQEREGRELLDRAAAELARESGLKSRAVESFFVNRLADSKCVIGQRDESLRASLAEQARLRAQASQLASEVARLEAECAHVRRAEAQGAAEIDRLRAEAAQRTDELARLASEGAQRTAEIERLGREKARLTRESADLADKNRLWSARVREHALAAEEARRAWEQRIAECQEEVRSLRAQLASLQAQFAEQHRYFVSSRSWRLTKPLRDVAGRLRKLRKR